MNQGGKEIREREGERDREREVGGKGCGSKEVNVEAGVGARSSVPQAVNRRTATGVQHEILG